MGYDVVIAGGGPAGSHLGARLALMGHKVAICEREQFPREHIGESLVPRVTVGLEEIGVLDKLLASDICVIKYGGWYDFKREDAPFNLFFSHACKLRDGYFRWAFHVDRPRFDKLLLDHCKELGVDVFEQTNVTAVERNGDITKVMIDGRAPLEAKIFVEATGRTSTLVGSRRRYISEFKNIAIWQHFDGCKPTATVDEDWNIYRQDSLERTEVHVPKIGPGEYFQTSFAPGHKVSTIGSFAFDDGWFWYIPVTMIIDGKPKVIHSIGLVTDVATMKKKNYRNMDSFMAAARKNRRLNGLLGDDPQPLGQEFGVAQNYSMADNELCSFSKRWILVGDSAFFVDPLFSSGAGNAIWMGRHAAFLIDQTLKGDLNDHDLADLWRDYREFWLGVGFTLGLFVDQWYHSIAREFPEGSYWTTRSNAPMVDARQDTLQSLIDSSMMDQMGGSIAEVDSTLDQYRTTIYGKEWENAGDRLQALGEDRRVSIDPERVGIRNGVRLWQSNLQDWPGEYWSNLPESASYKPKEHQRLQPCVRIYDKNDVDVPDVAVDIVDDSNAAQELYEILASGPQRLGSLKAKLSPEQLQMLARLNKREFLQIE